MLCIDGVDVLLGIITGAGTRLQPTLITVLFLHFLLLLLDISLCELSSIYAFARFSKLAQLNEVCNTEI